MENVLERPNLKVHSTAWPDGGHDLYGKEGMPRPQPKCMSRVVLKAVRQEVEKTYEKPTSQNN